MAHESLIEWNGFQSFKSRDFFCDSRERKQSNGKETSSDDAEPEELAEEYSSLTDEQMLEKASVAVQFEIGVKHTVMPTTFAKWHLKTNFHFSRLRCSRKCVSILKSHPTSRNTKSTWLRNYHKWSKIAHSWKSKITQCKFQTILSVNWNSTTLSMTFVTVWIIWILDYAW